MRILPVALVLTSTLVAAAGCGSSDTFTPVSLDAGGPPAADGGADAATPNGLGFVPTNLAAVDLSGALGDIVLEDCGAQVRAGDTGRLACFDPDDRDKPFRYTQVTQPDGTKIKVFVVRSLRIPSGVTAVLLGSDPIAIIALDTIEIEGSLAVSTVDTAGGFKAPDTGQTGNGPGGGKPATVGVGDGGGGYCGKGGAGGFSGGGAGGSTYGNVTISPLLGGSSGGGAFSADGGGALQLVAKNLIRISTGGSINMGGRGSDQGGAGAGGALLIEAAEVVVAGKIAANGGGGGAGTGPNDGQDGQLDTAPTPEGTGEAVAGGGGGKGGAGSAIDGQPGVANTTFGDGAFSGNGGGGAGRIRINTRSGSATISGLVSPTLTTVCATQGTLL